ncbi:MAG: flagellar hook-associated protein 3 [Bdellovibrionales bacterium GWA2_49_15]|nr:MAG: flagellar hook-associated protein 3 [Bdellovibrionales bacterium GWA2_49_15]
MTRVSENSNSASLQFSLEKTKERLEDLQMKGSSLKKVRRPSDNPVSNVEAMSLGSVLADNQQFLRNSDVALLHLNQTEQCLDQISEILLKAKDLAIQQSSDFYDQDIRKNVSNDIIQMRNQLLAISNRRVGNKYIFSGFNTLKIPFDLDGNYTGDDGKIKLEISKDFFIPMNLTGKEVFYSDQLVAPSNIPEPDLETPSGEDSETPARDLASNNDLESRFHKRDNLFSQLTTLISALENNDPKLVQDLLEKFDSSISRIITLRTRVGSLVNTAMTTRSQIETENVDKEAHRSKLTDADVAELFSDITKQQQVLRTTYQSGKTMLNQTLLDFLR